MGLTAIAIYNNYYYVYSSVAGIIAIFYTSITAGLGNSVALENRDANYLKFKKLIYINNWIVGWCAICMLCLYQPFIEIWTGKENMLYDSTVYLLSLYFYINMTRRIVVTFKDATGTWEKDRYKPLISGIINVIINILLIRSIGINGVIISTIIAFLVVETPWEMIVLFRDYFKRSTREYIVMLTFHFILIGCIGLLTYFLCSFVTGELLTQLVLKALICIVIPNALIILVWNKRISFIREYIKK